MAKQHGNREDQIPAATCRSLSTSSFKPHIPDPKKVHSSIPTSKSSPDHRSPQTHSRSISYPHLACPDVAPNNTHHQSPILPPAHPCTPQNQHTDLHNPQEKPGVRQAPRQFVEKNARRLFPCRKDTRLDPQPCPSSKLYMYNALSPPSSRCNSRNRRHGWMVCGGMAKERVFPAGLVVSYGGAVPSCITM